MQVAHDCMQAAYDHVQGVDAGKHPYRHGNLFIFMTNLLLIDLSGVKRIANDDHEWKISLPNVPEWTVAIGHLGRETEL